MRLNELIEHIDRWLKWETTSKDKLEVGDKLLRTCRKHLNKLYKQDTQDDLLQNIDVSNKDEIIKVFNKFDRYIIDVLEKKGFIQIPLLPQNIEFLKNLHLIWDSKMLIMLMFGRLDYKTRRRIFRACKLNAVGRYIYSRFYNSQKTVTLKTIQSELHKYLRIREKDIDIEYIKQVRMMAYNDRKADRKKT